MAGKLHFSLVSPERELFSGDVDQVDAPGSEGDFGVLPGHAPFMTTLKEGPVKVYNNGQVRLAPHMLFSRHDELYLAASTITRDGQPPREPKLGTFKLVGLKDLTVTDATFDAFPGFDPATHDHGGTTLFALELQPDERAALLFA